MKNILDTIILLTQSNFCTLGHETGWFDDIWIDNRKNFFATIPILIKIKKANFTIVYDLQCSNRTEHYRKLFKRKNTHWHARTEDSEENYQGLPTPHIFKRISLRAKAAGLGDHLFPDISWLKTSIDHFNLPEKYVVLIPGSASKHLNKRWTPEGYAELIAWLDQKNTKAVLIGTAEDADIITAITMLSKQNSVINLINECTLGMIAALCRKAMYVIGSDTGPMHIAGLCAPCITLFSIASDPIRNKAYGNNVQTLQRNNLTDLKTQDVISMIDIK